MWMDQGQHIWTLIRTITISTLLHQRRRNPLPSLMNYTFGSGSGSECLTYTFRTSCCSARLSRAQVPTFAGLAAKNLLYTPLNREDSIYHCFCYTSCGAWLEQEIAKNYLHTNINWYIWPYGQKAVTQTNHVI